jgi:hypothetical protein
MVVEWRARKSPVVDIGSFETVLEVDPKQRTVDPVNSEE